MQALQPNEHTQLGPQPTLRRLSTGAKAVQGSSRKNGYGTVHGPPWLCLSWCWVCHARRPSSFCRSLVATAAPPLPNILFSLDRTNVLLICFKSCLGSLWQIRARMLMRRPSRVSIRAWVALSCFHDSAPSGRSPQWFTIFDKLQMSGDKEKHTTAAQTDTKTSYAGRLHHLVEHRSAKNRDLSFVLRPPESVGGAYLFADRG